MEVICDERPLFSEEQRREGDARLQEVGMINRLNSSNRKDHSQGTERRTQDAERARFLDNLNKCISGNCQRRDIVCDLNGARRETVGQIVFVKSSPKSRDNTVSTNAVSNSCQLAGFVLPCPEATVERKPEATNNAKFGKG